MCLETPKLLMNLIVFRLITLWDYMMEAEMRSITYDHILTINFPKCNMFLSEEIDQKLERDQKLNGSFIESYMATTQYMSIVRLPLCST